MFYKSGSVSDMQLIIAKDNWRDFVKDSSVYLTKEAIENIIEENPYLKKGDFVFYLARFVSAGERWGFNGNRDYFPREELKKAFKTFLRRGVYINHDNYPKDKAIGIIPYVDYDEENDYVYGVLAISREYQDVINKIDNGQVEGTSMGCIVDKVKCPICGKEATDVNEYCEHLQNKLAYNAYEICLGVNFIEQSVLINEAPADSDALIVEKLAKKKGSWKEAVKVVDADDNELDVNELKPGKKVEFNFNGEIVQGEVREVRDNIIYFNLMDGGSHNIEMSRNNKLRIIGENELVLAGVKCEGQSDYLLVERGSEDEFYEGLKWWLNAIGFDNLSQKIEDIGKTGFLYEMKIGQFTVKYAGEDGGFISEDDEDVEYFYNIKKSGEIEIIIRKK